MVIVLALAAVPRARVGAQSMEEFFDDSTVHELRLTLNSKDWAALKENFKENIYYPAALQWRGVTVSQRRHPLARPRQPQRHQARAARRHRPLQRQPDLRRPEVVRARQPGPGSVDAARAADDGLLPPHGPAGAARGARAAVRQRHLRRASTRSSRPSTRASSGARSARTARAAPRTTATCSSTTTTREYRFENLGSNLDDYKIFDPKTHENAADRDALGPDRRHGQGDQRHPRRDLRPRGLDYLDLDEVRQPSRPRELPRRRRWHPRATRG